MLKQLEKEASIEAASIAPHAPDLRVLGIENVEAVLKLVGLVLLLQNAQVHQVTDVGHAFVDFASDFFRIGRVGVVLGNSLVHNFLGSCQVCI